MKNKPHIYRQGDVLIERVSKINPASKLQKDGQRIILAFGEVTGHNHSVESDDPADWWKTEGSLDDEQFVELKSPGKVVHQEHSEIPLSPGIYRVTRQREYSPEAIRKVAD